MWKPRPGERVAVVAEVVEVWDCGSVEVEAGGYRLHRDAGTTLAPWLSAAEVEAVRRLVAAAVEGGSLDVRWALDDMDLVLLRNRMGWP